MSALAYSTDRAGCVSHPTPTRRCTHVGRSWPHFVGLMRLGYMLGGRPSAEDTRKSARIREDSARFRADPPNFRQKKFPANSAERRQNVRRTPPNSARIRANPRGLCRELAELFARKMSAEKYFQKLLSAAEELPPRTFFRRRSSADG